MKLSIAWIFDHIDADWKTLDIPKLIDRFNLSVAEIEGFEKIHVNLDQLAFGRVEMTDKSMKVEVPEWHTTVTLPIRPHIDQNSWYLVAKQEGTYRWATMQDFGAHKDSLLPPMRCDERIAKGEWKKAFEVDDYIIDVDNKSITNRPDLWGHRGFAREIAALLEKPFISVDEFLVNKEIQQFDVSAPATEEQPFAIQINDTQGCKRFAALYLDSIEHAPSLIWMASRLSRVDSKPIDAIVDMTNYVMLDIGHPMHAFDADKLQNKHIVVRKAKKGENLELLDDQEIELSDQDVMIVDGDRVVSLAGIMGGKDSGISSDAKHVLLEAAWFDPATIRRSATRHKIRTEASARFEKSLDMQNNLHALKRFVKLLTDAGMGFSAAQKIISVGVPYEPVVIDVPLSLFEKKIGIAFTPEHISSLLKPLGFEVDCTQDVCTITVPSFRSSKDVTIKEDIVEEVSRLYGYDKIPLSLPSLKTKPKNLHAIQTVQKIKQYCQLSGKMREIYSHALYDESFLRHINWDPGKTLEVIDPVSENWKRLVNSLVPHLFKAIDQNVADHDQLRFFEWARVWQLKGVSEQKIFAGILFEKKQELDFYTGKEIVTGLYNLIGIPVAWERIDSPDQPWFTPYQTARLVHNGQTVGFAGIVPSQFLGQLSEGSAFVFELDGDFMITYQAPEKKFVPLSKYPAVSRDISMMVPLSLTVREISTAIKDVDPRITQVTLIDFFEKKEWVDIKSVTMRFVLLDRSKTLTKEEVDQVYDKIVAVLEPKGAQIR